MLPPWAQRISALLSASPEKSGAGLARACGIKQGSVSGWLGGGKPTKMISGDNLVAAAEYLGTTPEYIITGRHPALASQSQPARLDQDIVRGVARAMQEVFEELAFKCSTADTVEIFAELYDRVGASGITTADVVWLTRRVEQGAGYAGRSGVSNG